jgi:hypothetical protein
MVGPARIQAHDRNGRLLMIRSAATGLQCRTGEVFAALGVQSRFDDVTHECAGEKPSDVRDGERYLLS